MARILGAKGLAGAVRIELLTDWPEQIVPGVQLWIEGDPGPTRVAEVERGGRTLVIRLDDVASREAAEALSGRHLEAPARTLPEETYYWDDLVGLHVEDPSGAAVGELVEVFRAGGNEVYRVVGDLGERLVPALRSTVLRIDLEENLMVIAADNAEEVR